MPVYNAEKYLRRSLDCVLAQTLGDFELICVDDGSTDSSPSILEEYEAKDPRVSVLTQKNSGAGAARNTGLEKARGEYLAFLDSDDLYEPDMLATSYARAHENDADVVVFRCDRFTDDVQRAVLCTEAIRRDLIPQNEPFAGKDIQWNIFFSFLGWTWDKLFKEKFVRDNRLKFQKQRTTNDLLFVFSAILKAERIVTLDNVFAHHRDHRGSISVTREKSWRCFYDALTALRERLIEWGLFERREQDFVNYSFNFALWHLNTLHGPAYHALYEKLKNEWFDNLGMTSHGMDYFYNREEWKTFQNILDLSSEEFLLWRIVRDEMDKNSDHIRAVEATLKEANATIAERDRQLQDAATAIAERDKQITDIRTGMSFRIGRVITFIPRKILKRA